MEWLCILSGNTIDYYYDKWSPTDRQPRPELPLTEALPLDFRSAEDYFLGHFLSVRRTTPYDVVPPPARLDDAAVKTLVRTLRKKSWLFTDWLMTYKSFHEGLGGPPSWDWAGTSDQRLLHDLTLLPILTEKILLDVTSTTSTIGAAPEFRDLVKDTTRRLEAVKPEFAGAWQLASAHWQTHTLLKSFPPDPFGTLRALAVGGQPVPAALAKALLFFGLSRNYFAHHFYKHHQLVGTAEGGSLMAGIITTTLYLTAPACGI
jgi:hypothetical protein